MATWDEFVAAAPALAAKVNSNLDRHRHLTVATLRRDGAPRICGTEVVRLDGRLWLEGMVRARRFDDLRRDPRFALHGGPDDPQLWRTDPHAVCDVKIAGTAQQVHDLAVHAAMSAAQNAQAPPEEQHGVGSFELFALDVTEVVAISADGGGLLIETWRPADGVRRLRPRAEAEAGGGTAG